MKFFKYHHHNNQDTVTHESRIHQFMKLFSSSANTYSRPAPPVEESLKALNAGCNPNDPNYAADPTGRYILDLKGQELENYTPPPCGCWF